MKESLSLQQGEMYGHIYSMFIDVVYHRVPYGIAQSCDFYCAEQILAVKILFQKC